jgi:hypothetical protein
VNNRYKEFMKLIKNGSLHECKSFYELYGDDNWLNHNFINTYTPLECACSQNREKQLLDWLVTSGSNVDHRARISGGVVFAAIDNCSIDAVIWISGQTKERMHFNGVHNAISQCFEYMIFSLDHEEIDDYDGYARMSIALVRNGFRNYPRIQLAPN